MDDKAVKKQKLPTGGYGLPKYKGTMVSVGEAESQEMHWARFASATTDSESLFCRVNVGIDV